MKQIKIIVSNEDNDVIYVNEDCFPFKEQKI